MGIALKDLKGIKTERGRIVDFLMKNKGLAFTVKEIADAIGKENVSNLSTNLYDMARNGKVTKHKVGHSVYYSL